MFSALRSNLCENDEHFGLIRTGGRQRNLGQDAEVPADEKRKFLRHIRDGGGGERLGVGDAAAPARLLRAAGREGQGSGGRLDGGAEIPTLQCVFMLRLELELEVQPNACHVHIILIFVPQKLLRSYMGTSHPTRASAVLTADAPQSSYPSASRPCPLAFPGSL